MINSKRLGALALVAFAAACGIDPEGPDLGTEAQPVWVNGDFENDNAGIAPSGWTVSTNLGNNITDLRPGVQTLASLNLSAGGAAMTTVVAGAPETQTDPELGTAGTLRFPKYGQRAVRLNYAGAGANGSGRNSNTMRQTMTIGLGDVDPTDDKVHVRFAVAPILQNPGHAYHEQPYYYVRLQNLTTGQAVYQDFNASGQPGVPWKNFTDSTAQQAQYTDWQLVDISPGPGVLSVGDQVELTVVATGCSLGGHWGRVYVDAVGSGIPGLYAWATGPQLANAGANIAYSVNYKNGGTTTTSGTRLDFVTPPNTTYVANGLGAACTTPAVGGTGTVSCPLGTLAPGATGSFTVTVNVPPATANGTVVTNGNYAIYATGVSALVGPKVFTTVTGSVSYADVGVTVSDGVAALGWGQATTYTIDVTNLGPLAPPSTTVVDTMPAQLTNVSWTCVASGGAVCPASGTGSINHTVALPVGGHAVYTVTADVVAGSGSSQVVHRVTVTPSIADPDSNNNTAVDTNAIGTLRTLSLTKTGDVGGGTITSTPSSISCGPGCSSDSASFLDGNQVVLTAAPITGATFTGWSGACSGTASSCTVTMAGAQSVSAAFVGAPTTATISGGSSQATAVSTAFASPLVVRVTDAGGRAVPGVTVTFAAPGSGASAALSAASAITNTAGDASITATANAIPGAYAVSLAAGGVTAPPVFLLSNLGAPTSVTATGGGAQSAMVTTPFATQLAVVVRDAASQPRPDTVVTFEVPAGGATAALSSATATTDASGVARVSATAGTVAGAYSVTARVAGVGATASFALTNTAGPPSAVVAVAGSGQSAEVTQPFATSILVTVVDAFGNPVPGAVVTFTAPGGGASASFTPATATTSVTGQASVSATAGTVAGSYTIQAAVAGATPASFTLTNTAGPVASLAIIGGQGQSAVVTTAFAAPLAVRALDAHANVVPGVMVSFAAPSSGATATVVTSATADATGLVAIGATAGTVAGAYPVSASASGAAPVIFALTNLPGAAVAITVISGGGQRAEVATTYAAPLVARVTDAHGNSVPGATVFTSTPLSGPGATDTRATVTPSIATSDADGLISLTVTAGEHTGSYVVTVLLDAETSAGFDLENLPGAPAAITVAAASSPQATEVRTAFAAALTVTVADRFGNVTPGITVTYGAPAGGATATFAAATATTDDDGVAAVFATAGAIAGSYHATAAVTGVATAGEIALTNLSGPAATVAVTGGEAQAAVVDTAFAEALEVLVLDADGNPVPEASVVFTVPGDGATAVLSASTVATDADGLASVTARAGTITGAYQVAALIAGGSTPAVFELVNTPGAPATIAAAVTSTPQAARVTTLYAHALIAGVTDSFGNAVPGVTITYAVPAAGATGELEAATAVTDGDGQAAVFVTAGSVAGSFTATAAVAGVTIPATFELTNLHGAAHHLVAVTGADQATVVDEGFAAPLRARVEDAQGNPVAGATVAFTAPATGATAVITTPGVVTGADGMAATALTAGFVTGSYLVRATADLAATPVTFALTNTAGVPATVTADLTASPQSAEVLTAFYVPLAVTVRDRFANLVPGAPVEFAGPAAAVTATLSAPQVVTGDTGAAQVIATASAATGSYQVTAIVGGAEAAAVFALTNTASAPGTVVVVGGAGQRALATTAFADPVRFRVVDALGNAVPGVTVDLAMPVAGATASTLDLAPITGDDGEVAVMVTAGAVVGDVAVIARVAGAQAPVTAMLTIDAIPTTLTATAPAELAVDQTVTVTLAITGEVGTPVGDVELLAGEVVVGTATLADGAATIDVVLPARGDHTLTARFQPQGSFGGSTSGPVELTALDDEGSLSGGGCDAGGGASIGTLMLLLMVAAVAARRRRGGLVVATVATAVTMLHLAPAAAQPEGARAIARFHAAGADSTWFSLDSLGFEGDWEVAMATTWDYAHRPLVAYDADGAERTVIVRDAVAFQAGLSLTLRERFRLTGTAPMSVFQDGDDAVYNGMTLGAPTFAFGDVRVGGDIRVLGSAASGLRAAVGVRVTFPTGSRTNYMSDGLTAIEPRATVAGSRGVIEYAASASAVLREANQMAGEAFGSELRYGAAAGIRVNEGRFLVGPELAGATPLTSADASGHPLEVGLGIHYQASGLMLGVGGTLGVVNAVGTPDQRVFLSVGWNP